MKIHIISNSPKTNSGFAIVSKYLAKELQDLGHKITMHGLQTAHISEWVNNIEVIPTQVQYIDDITKCMVDIQRINPDVVLCIFQADLDFNNFAKIFSKTVWYPPVEGRNIPQKMAQDLLQVKMNGGTIVAQCKYGQKEMELTLTELQIPYIYHGYNDKIFKPLDLKKGLSDDIKYCYYRTENGIFGTNPVLLHQQKCYDCKLDNREQTKCPYYREENVVILRFIEGKWSEENILISQLSKITSNKFTFGFVGANIGVRKRIERLLRAYSIFINQSRMFKDRTILHLHTMPIDINGINLIKVIQDLGIQDNITFSYGAFRSYVWSEEAINILYNTFDVNVSASSSEGFGLPTLESMACGRPNIGPDCSSFTELIGEDEKTRRGLLAKISDWQMIQDGSVRALVNESDLAYQMKVIYQGDDLRKMLSKNAIKFAKDYTWNKVCLEWNKLLNKLSENV